jgi:hypothetical protein
VRRKRKIGKSFEWELINEVYNVVAVVVFCRTADMFFCFKECTPIHFINVRGSGQSEAFEI